MKVGFIGTGAIGAPMALRLLDCGHDLVVHDLDPRAIQPLLREGATAATSPKHVADACEVVVLSLPTQQATHVVVFGNDGCVYGQSVKVLVNTSTVGMQFSRDLMRELSGWSIALVDCPISGGVTAAKAGNLSVMVSGDRPIVEALRPLTSCWGKTTTYVGAEAGAAQALKLVNNILSIVALAATSEAMIMGAKAGLDPEVMLNAINAGSGRNSATDTKFPMSVLDRSFAYGGTIQVAVKDAELAIEQGESLGVPMWVCQAARLVFKHAMFAGEASDDVTTIVRHIERAARFELPQTR